MSKAADTQRMSKSVAVIQPGPTPSIGIVGAEVDAALGLLCQEHDLASGRA